MGHARSCVGIMALFVRDQGYTWILVKLSYILSVSQSKVEALPQIMVGRKYFQGFDGVCCIGFCCSSLQPTAEILNEMGLQEVPGNT